MEVEESAELEYEREAAEAAGVGAVEEGSN